MGQFNTYNPTYCEGNNEGDDTVRVYSIEYGGKALKWVPLTH